MGLSIYKTNLTVPFNIRMNDTTVANTITQVIVILVHAPHPFTYTDNCMGAWKDIANGSVESGVTLKDPV